MKFFVGFLFLIFFVIPNSWAAPIVSLQTPYEGVRVEIFPDASKKGGIVVAHFLYCKECEAKTFKYSNGSFEVVYSSGEVMEDFLKYSGAVGTLLVSNSEGVAEKFLLDATY
ncbi:hypothetical protein [Marinibactrum halimedae]|uniref:Uncharacterized protein n=1 Tax=Marinibactrum halimedae TaxID=1444977 RepID=A0AA37WQJ9_9GAMM|nr:hypothetical protein [Marinibactrum halimedae]MCD9459507.1 hypothetical protein [Marinibactrum halimedae]GLS28161.1 hypothetical protein GCM10007877_38800 [Marinibactrum halimedae]